MDKAKTSFRKINTELLKAIIQSDLTRAEYKIILTVIHFTLGYHRIEADISLKTFADYTGITRLAVKNALKLLQNKNVIRLVRPATNRNSAVYQLNTSFKDWRTGIVHSPSRGIPDYPSREVVRLPCNNTKTYPLNDENLPSRGIVATPGTEPLKIKDNSLKITAEDDDFCDQPLMQKLREVSLSNDDSDSGLSEPSPHHHFQENNGKSSEYDKELYYAIINTIKKHRLQFLNLTPRAAAGAIEKFGLKQTAAAVLMTSQAWSEGILEDPAAYFQELLSEDLDVEAVQLYFNEDSLPLLRY